MKSYHSDAIVNEYRRQQYYKNKQREKCKEKDCEECKWSKVCTETERKDEEC